MIVISHRGNTSGSVYQTENQPQIIQSLLDKGIHVEIDVWFVENIFLLGHDEPLYKTDLQFLLQKNLWCHAKNLAALEAMLTLDINCFWHENDKHTLTSNGYIWTYPDQNIGEKSIIVDTSKNWKEKNYDCYAVCVDYL
jgi:hypothetical protein